jgi:hypothetical protein
MIFVFGLQVLERLAAFAQDVFFPVQQFLPEVLALRLVHEGLVFGRPILPILHQDHIHTLTPLNAPVARVYSEVGRNRQQRIASPERHDFLE